MCVNKLKNVDVVVLVYYLIKICQYNIHRCHHGDLIKPFEVDVNQKIHTWYFHCKMEDKNMAITN